MKIKVKTLKKILFKHSTLIQIKRRGQMVETMLTKKWLQILTRSSLYKK